MCWLHKMNTNFINVIFFDFCPWFYISLQKQYSASINLILKFSFHFAKFDFFPFDTSPLKLTEPDDQAVWSHISWLISFEINIFGSFIKTFLFYFHLEKRTLLKHFCLKNNFFKNTLTTTTTYLFNRQFLFGCTWNCINKFCMLIKSIIYNFF